MDTSLRISADLAAEIDRLATAFAKDPRSKAFMPLAECYLKAGMWQEAAGVLEDGLRVYPGFVTAMAALGRVYHHLGQTEKAKTVLTDVIKQSPDNLRAHRILAQLFSREGEAAAALASCAAILSVNPSDSEALAIQQSLAGRPADVPKVCEAAELSQVEALSPDVSAVGTPGTSGSSDEPIIDPGSAAAAPAGAPLRKAAAVTRLEAWLRTVRARRCSSSPCS